MRVLLISFATVAVLLSALYGARIYGLQTSYQRFEHPFWTTERPVWSVVTRSSEEVKRLLQVKSDVIPWLDIQLTQDGHFLIVPQTFIRDLLTQKAMGEERWRGPHPHRYDLETLRSLFPDAPLLIDLLTEFRETRFILNLPGNAPDLEVRLLAALEPHQAERRLLIHCTTDSVLRGLREKQPRWLYSSSQADLMRWLSFDSIGLLPTIGFKGDVFVAPLQHGDRDLELAPLVQEAHRRKKDFLIGPMTHSGNLEAARQLGADGYVFATFELFLALLDQKSL